MRFLDLGLIVLIAVLAVVVTLTTGCSTTRDYNQLTSQVAEYGVSKVVDKKEQKVCYFYRDADNFAMQCSDRKRGE